MRVAIVNITNGGMSGGYRKYLRNVIPRMAKYYDVEAILCVSPNSIGVQDWFDLIPNVRFVMCKPSWVPFLQHDVELLRELEKFSPDVIFVPVERSFRLKQVPVVAMIQNMEPLVYSNEGNPLSEKFKNWVRVIIARQAVKKADRIIAISNFVKDFLIKKCNIAEEKIGIVYHGTNLQDIDKVQNQGFIPEDWNGKFLFTAGSIRPARGLEDLLIAMEHIMSNNIPVSGLVIAGSSSGNMASYYSKLCDLVKKKGLEQKVCWAGELDQEAMNWCYRNCFAFVMTSRVESFGQTALEAMSQGAICISADNPCLPEIFGDAAIYYSPKDIDALVQAVQSVFEWSLQDQENVRKKAKARASQFSWDFCAEKLIKELQKAITHKEK